MAIKDDLTNGQLSRVTEDFGKQDPDLTGAIGQFMGDPDTYSPDQQQLRTAAQQYHGISSDDWDKLSEAEKAEAVDSFVKADQAQISSKTQTSADKTAKNPPKAAESDTDKALTDISNYLTSDVAQGEEAMGEEGQQLAQQNAAVTSVVGQYIGGDGVNSGNAAVNAAMAAYQKAYSAGEGLNSASYANMGAANAQYLAAAPEQSIVNLLTQGLGSGQYKELPASVVDNLPQDVREALAAAGVGLSTGQNESGGNPIPTTKTVKGAAGANDIGTILSQIENAGATGTANPQSGISTNPNTPGS